MPTESKKLAILILAPCVPSRTPPYQIHLPSDLTRYLIFSTKHSSSQVVDITRVLACISPTFFFELANLRLHAHESNLRSIDQVCVGLIPTTTLQAQR